MALRHVSRQLPEKNLSAPVTGWGRPFKPSILAPEVYIDSVSSIQV